MDTKFLNELLQTKSLTKRPKITIDCKTKEHIHLSYREVFEELNLSNLSLMLKLKEDEYLIKIGSVKIVDKQTYVSILSVLLFKPRNNQEYVARDLIIEIILAYLSDREFQKPKITSRALKNVFDQMYTFLMGSNIVAKEKR